MGRGYHPRSQGKVAFEFTSQGGIAQTATLLGPRPLSFATAAALLSTTSEGGTGLRRVIASAAFEVSVDLKFSQSPASSTACQLLFGESPFGASPNDEFPRDPAFRMLRILAYDSGFKIQANGEASPSACKQTKTRNAFVTGQWMRLRVIVSNEPRISVWINSTLVCDGLSLSTASQIRRQNAADVRVDDDSQNATTRCVDTLSSAPNQSLGDSPYINLPTAGECEGHTPNPAAYPVGEKVIVSPMNAEQFTADPWVQATNNSIANGPIRRMSFEGRNYVFVGTKKKFHEAELDCRRRFGMHLVSVHSFREWLAITRSLVAEWLKGSERVQIGFSDREKEGLWTWTDGSPVDFLRWSTNQPDNYYGNQDCGSIYLGPVPKWDDERCNRAYYYVCADAAKSRYEGLVGRTFKFEQLDSAEPDAFGTVLETNSAYLRGIVAFTNKRHEIFKVYHDEPGKIYWDLPRGTATNIWTSKILRNSSSNPLEGIYGPAAARVSLVRNSTDSLNKSASQKYVASLNMPAPVTSILNDGITEEHVTVNGRRFIMVITMMTVSEADNYCQQKHSMRTASFHSQAEFDTVNVLLYKGADIWFGSRLDSTTQRFVNSDGSAFDFADFGESTQALQYSCLRAHHDEQFGSLWSYMKTDLSCNIKLWFYCADPWPLQANQSSASAALNSTKTAPPASSPFTEEPKTYHVILSSTAHAPAMTWGDRRYIIIADPKTQADALAYCKASWGMSLASFHSKKELLYIRDKLVGGQNGEVAWIGLVGNKTEGGSFGWSDGSPVNFLPATDPVQTKMTAFGGYKQGNGITCFSLNNLGALVPSSCDNSYPFVCADSKPGTSKALRLRGAVRNFKIIHDKPTGKSYALAAGGSGSSLLNGDFELPKRRSSSTPSQPPSFWLSHNASVAQQRSASMGGLDSGSGMQALVLEGPGSFVRQNITGFLPNKTYTVHFLAAAATSSCPLHVVVNGTVVAALTSLSSRGFAAFSSSFTAAGPTLSLSIENIASANGVVCLVDGIVVRRAEEDGRAIAATRRAFAAILPNGTVIAWGDKDAGGEIPPLKDKLLRSSGRAAALFATTSRGDESGQMFTAWLSDGSVVSWGAQDAREEGRVRFSCHENVGSPSPSTLTCIRGACPVPDTEEQLMTFSKCRKRCVESEKLVLCGGFFFDRNSAECILIPHPTERVPVSAITTPSYSLYSESLIPWVPLRNAYCTLLAAKHIVRDSIVASDLSFAGIRVDGSIAAWGYKDFGGSTPPHVSSSRATKLVAGASSFAAITKDHTVVAWGHGSAGLVPAETQARVAQGKVASLVSSGWAFAVLLNDTKGVVTWGLPEAGGDMAANGKNFTEAVSHGVAALTGTNYAFAARKEGGGVVAWGNVHCGGYTDPILNKLQSGVFDVFAGAVNGGVRGCGSFLATRWRHTYAPSNSPTTNAPTTSAPTYTPPMLLEARLAESLQYIVLTFHKPTNVPTEQCSILLSAETLVKLGKFRIDCMM
eukprot:jgi/Bigna1/130826/aug1.12_g5534